MKKFYLKVKIGIKEDYAFLFFFFLINALVYTCSYHVYRNPVFDIRVFGEYIFDALLLAFLFSLLPKKFSKVLKVIFFVYLYVVSLIDLILVSKFESTISPSLLQLAVETDLRETKEFFSVYFTYDIFSFPVLLLLLIGLLQIVFLKFERKFEHKFILLWTAKKSILQHIIEILVIFIFAFVCLNIRFIGHQKKFQTIVFTCHSIGDIEYNIVKYSMYNDYNDPMNSSILRSLYSMYSCHLLNNQIDKLKESDKKIQIESCSHISPNIVLIIGESYNKHHSQLYGYRKATTPNQVKWQKSGNLIAFTDAITPWDLTSYAFKHLLTTYCIGDKGEWCDYPLIATLMKKAGYHVSFFTNQFANSSDSRACDISGGFFLNDPELSKSQFDNRNLKTSSFDGDLISKCLKELYKPSKYNFTIIHLLGQHFNYSLRSPKLFKKLTPSDYHRDDLSPENKQILADYDNSIIYNDYVLSLIINKFDQEDAIIIYLPDHAERVFGPGKCSYYGRQSTIPITVDNATENFEIPMWIYCTQKYKSEHPQIINAVQKAKDRPYMSDAIPHLLLHLGGVETETFNPSCDILSIKYNENRRRLMRGQTDYDTLVKH